MIQKVGHPDYQVDNLPGLDGYDYNPQAQPIKYEDLDSEEQAEVDPLGKILPKKRKEPSCGEILKEIDMFGITPSMMVGHQ